MFTMMRMIVMVMMIVNVNDGDDLGKEHEVNASPNMARHCWVV